MVAFATHAAVSATWGPRVVALRDAAGLSNGRVGLALGAIAVGLLAGTRLAGPLDARIGTERAIRLAAPLACLALVPPAFAHRFATLAVGLFVLGACGGLLDVAMNEHAVAVERASGRPLMSGIHGVWSGGMLAVSGVSAVAAGLGIGVEAHFTTVAVVGSVASAVALHDLQPAGPAAAERPPLLASAGQRRVALLVCAICFADYFSEGATADWSSVFLHDAAGASTGVAAMGFLAFAGGMTAARVVGDRLAARHGPVPLVRAGAVCAAAALAVAVLVPRTAVVLPAFAVIGAALAPIIPIAFSAAGNTAWRHGRTALPLAVTVAYCGSIAGPAAIGLVAGEIGLRAGVALPVALVLAIAALAGATRAAPGGRDR
jgi:predicted MFS family arabinose efflux permease